MSFSTATAEAHPNIAFVKYWGNRDEDLRLPQNGSISMNLGDLVTRTMVTFDSSLPRDTFDLNGIRQSGAGLDRVSRHLNLIRGIRGFASSAHIFSESNFPAGAGLASSAAAFAALTVAAVRAAGMEMDEKALSRLARRGSGSAARSIPGGFVEWYRGEKDEDSYAASIAPANHWELVDCIAIIDSGEKKTGSSEGHRLAHTSPLQSARVADAERRLALCRNALLERDFDALASVIELDSNLLHSIAMTSNPAVYYWKPATIDLMKTIINWRQTGLPVAFTLDAGPNVHVICEKADASDIKDKISDHPGVLTVMFSTPGEGTFLI
ncbi:MAG: diphosphomevalonate decarboxylase [Anaerolineaceae bacterium]|jgi:diphosphomevalonate decarboxylase